jgi:hypothetical protein
MIQFVFVHPPVLDRNWAVYFLGLALGAVLGYLAGCFNRNVPPILAFWLIAFGLLMFLPLDWFSRQRVSFDVLLGALYVPPVGWHGHPLVGSVSVVLICQTLASLAIAYLVDEGVARVHIDSWPYSHGRHADVDDESAWTEADDKENLQQPKIALLQKR